MRRETLSMLYLVLMGDHLHLPSKQLNNISTFALKGMFSALKRKASCIFALHSGNIVACEHVMFYLVIPCLFLEITFFIFDISRIRRMRTRKNLSSLHAAMLLRHNANAWVAIHCNMKKFSLK